MKERSLPAARIGLLVVTLLGLGLRLYRLDGQSLWYDEGFSVYLARMDLAEITARTAADIQPPLYYYLLHGWIKLFGSGEAALRSLSLLAGVLTIPLIYAAGRQLFGSRLAGLLAALLLAVSPVHLWYGQEARMYTLLTLLCLLSSYLLLRIVACCREMEGQAWCPIAALWAAYAAANIAALYAHYFALFILGFQVLWLLAVLLFWRPAGRRWLGLALGGLGAALAMGLAYWPWLPYLLNRYAGDVSYWPGRLQLSGAAVDLVAFFVGGESLPEPLALRLALGFGVILILCLAALQGARARKNQSGQEDLPQPPAPGGLLFLGLYLLLPPALILALSFASPKFNARYAMVAHPALLLLLGGGLAAPWRRGAQRLGSLALRLPAALAMLFLLGVSAYADYGAYTDPTFARADFRGMARYLRKQLEPGEAILLCSGHMFPLFDYYLPGAERYLLPDSPTLDTTRTLDYSIAADLNRWLAGRSGTWVVLWQDEVVDPVGYLAAMLAEVGEEQPLKRSFAGVALRHYRLADDARFAGQPAIAHPTDLNFGNRLRLLGYNQADSRRVALFWQALQPLEEDYRVSLILRDAAGVEWVRWDGRPAAYLFPTTRWRAGTTVFGQIELEPAAGTPPGEYGLEVGVYTEADPVGLDLLDANGVPQGKRAMLGAVRLAVQPATAEQVGSGGGSPPTAAAGGAGPVEMGGSLQLLDWALDRPEGQPGDRLVATLLWTATSPPAGDYQGRLVLRDATGRTLDAGSFPPTNAWHPTGSWLAGQVWRGQVAFRLPIEAEPGPAQLSVQLLDAAGLALGPAVDLITVEVLSTDRIFVAPQPQVPRRENLDDQVMLWGADLASGRAEPGEELQVTLYWQAQRAMDLAYTVFVHLLGPDGRVVAGHDGEPAGGARPTTGWVPGEFVADRHGLVVPAGLEPGSYQIEVGLYQAGASGMPRLPVLGSGGQVEANRILIGPVEVR